MIRLAADTDWLHKAMKEISKYCRQKRERRQNPELVCHGNNLLEADEAN
jgi:hypothetical protein